MIIDIKLLTKVEFNQLIELVKLYFKEIENEMLDDDSATSYLYNVEKQLEQILSAMEGVGDVKVMITTNQVESDIFGTQNIRGSVMGVLIVAEGAGNATVNTRISEAVKALFSIDAHKISIVKMRSQEDRK